MLAWGHHQLMAADLSAEAPAAVTLTSGRFHDTSPSFSRCGKYLIFLSARTFDPVYDDHSFDLGTFVAGNLDFARCVWAVNPVLAVALFLAVSGPVGLWFYWFGPKRAKRE